jgi:hypothetical protein
MSRFGVVLLSGVILFSPAIASAQTATLEICNNGRLDVDVAVAARIQLFITGYRWKSTGWYTVPAGGCAVVYDEDFDAAGPYTPQSGARVAFTVVKSDGVWGAYHKDLVQRNGWMQSGTGVICVKRGVKFTIERPAGDPAANCSDGITIPVAHDFVPDAAGKFTYTMDWDGDGYFLPLGKSDPSSNTANAKSSDEVDNSLSAQFLRALAQAAKDASNKPASSSDLAATDAKGRAAMLQWVREDLTAYLEASKTGFESYKSGEVQPSAGADGSRVWSSSVKPSLAEGCWVIQGASTKFYCSIPLKPDLTAARSYYAQLTEDVTASLPGDWSADAAPPYGGPLPSMGYRSSSGEHGEVWLVDAASGGGYELHYELVSAATAPQPPKPPEDDPIGHGGFITPPKPPNR